jgi:uncharacterized protein YceH (UPF0502 family)
MQPVDQTTRQLAAIAPEQDERIAELEATVAQLKSDFDSLKKRLDDLLG